MDPTASGQPSAVSERCAVDQDRGHGGSAHARCHRGLTAFTPEEVAAAVDEAHKWDVPIAAHAIGRTGIDHCVRAGIDSIEHGAQITAETARQMKERGIFHVPTISALLGIVDHPKDVPVYAVEKGRQIVDMLRDTFRRNVRLGVRFACGTARARPTIPTGTLPGRWSGWWSGG